MASSKLVALFLAFAVAAAALQPSAAARVQAQQRCKPPAPGSHQGEKLGLQAHQGCKPAPAPSSHDPEKVTLQADGAGVPSQPTTTPPGIPAGAGQLPPGLLPAILGMLFPPAADGGSTTPPGVPSGAGQLPQLLPAILGMLFPPAANGTGVPAGAGQLPPGLLPAILGLLFPPLGGIIGLLQPLIPPPGSQPQLGGVLLAASGSSPSPPPQPTECMTPLQSMLSCTDYLTNLTVAAPPGECCDGLKNVIRDAPICLCHGLNGGMSQFLPSPVDPLRMAVLPLTCGAVLPIQTLLTCNSQQVPPIMPPAPATPATPTPVSP